MSNKIKPLLFKFDFIGFIPQFRILEEARYKSLFSSFLSIAIIIFSIAFVFHSFVNYLNQNPQVQYYKNNDFSTNKTYTISNSLLMFQNNFRCYHNDIDNNNNNNLTITINDPKYLFRKEITYEACELGKNLDIKYKDIVETFENVEMTKLSDYLCLNFSEEFTLINNPYIPDELEKYLEFRIETDCENYILDFNLITQNDFIEHNNKNNPIIPYFQKHRIRSNSNPTNLLFYYNYIKYESDDGIIFSNKKNLEGIGISNSNIYDKNELFDYALSIEFRINGASYDYYQRSFIKFQAFLADVTSLINLLITICKTISEFLLYKKMNKDIIRYILTSNEVNNNNISKEKQFHKIFDNNIDIEKNKSIKNEVENKIIESPKSATISNEKNDSDYSKNGKENDKVSIVMKKLKLFNIIKSFFCCKNKKMKLICLCNEIINKDICIEKILKRLYLIENEFDVLRNEKFSEIEDIIDNINNDLSNRIKDINEKDFNKNNKIT